MQENVLTDGEGEGSGEECEVTDECAMLLNTPAGAIHKVIKTQDKSGKLSFCNLLNTMTFFFYFYCYTVHVVESLNYYTNQCTRIKFTH